MEQEQTVVDVDIADGGTRLAVGAHIGQLVVLAEGLARGRGTDAAGDVEFLGDDVAPDIVDGVDVGLVTRQGRHVGHARIHIGGTHGVTHGLVLLGDGLVALGILLLDGGLATVVEQELGKVEIALLAGGQVEARHGHLGYLVTGHDTQLSGTGADLAAGHIGIAAGNVEELTFAGSLPVGHGTLHHVAQVIQFVAQVLLLHPAAVAGPVVRIGRILRAGGIEVAVRLLRRGNDVDDRVAVGFEPLVRIGLQDVGGTLQGLVRVGIVERVAHAIDLKDLRGVFQVLGGMLEVLVTPLALAFRESQGNGGLATGFETLPPERAGRHLDSRKGYGRDGIAVLRPCGAK